MKRYLLVHYGEIGLKLGNKDYFVKKLIRALKLRLKKKFGKSGNIDHFLGRLMIPLEEDFDEREYVDVVEKIFGIKNFHFVFAGSADVDKLGEEIWENLPKWEKENRPKSFRVKVKRAMKMPFSSIESERKLGSVLWEKGLNMKVKLKGADFIVYVEFFNDYGYFSFKKYDGSGGLSSNSQGKLISLISSGIDSPVSSYMMMRRGARIIFVHFHGYPWTDKEESEQVKDLVQILSEYQADTKLYLVPFGDIQREIALNFDVPAKIRTVLYRRIMLKIAEKIAFKEKAKGLVTGDSFGQVASQTPENIFAIHECSQIPLFQPLIGFDKEDVIRLAEKIGTFEISKLPCKDTCSMFMPKSPELKANIHDVIKYEENLPVEKWIEDSIQKSELLSEF